MIEIIKKFFIDQDSYIGLKRLIPVKPKIFYGNFDKSIINYKKFVPQKMPILLIDYEYIINTHEHFLL